MSVTIILTTSVFRPSKILYFRLHHYFCVQNPLKLRYISVFRLENRSISDFRKMETSLEGREVELLHLTLERLGPTLGPWKLIEL